MNEKHIQSISQLNLLCIRRISANNSHINCAFNSSELGSATTISDKLRTVVILCNAHLLARYHIYANIPHICFPEYSKEKLGCMHYLKQGWYCSASKQMTSSRVKE